MLKLNNSFSHILLVAAVLAPVISFFIISLTFQDVNGQKANNSYKINAELMISSKDMNCDYHLEDYDRLNYNFEYPKMIITENGTPIVAFIDESSKKLIFTEISNKRIKVINIIKSFAEYVFDKWPIILLKENKIYLAVIKNIKSDKKEYVIQLYLLDRGNSNLYLQKEISLTSTEVINELNSRSGSRLSGVYAYSGGPNRFLVVGRFNESHFHPLALFSGEFPTFTKNFSLIWEDNKIGNFRTIEEEGWFGAQHRVYAVSDAGIAHSAWIRDTARPSLSTKKNKTVCFSENKKGGEWTKPLEIYSVKKTDIYNHLSNLSLASHGRSAFMLWQDVNKGFYFGEVKDGILHEMTQISGLKPSPDKMGDVEPLSGASTVKITTDHHGNVYALWVMNSRSQYQMFIKTRFNGRWTDSMIVNSGSGIVKLPDMKVDKKGIIHITYLKQGPEEQFKFDRFGCYYINLNP